MSWLTHRDIKPSNIFFKNDAKHPGKGIWKIGDFGLATTSTSLFSTPVDSNDELPDDYTRGIGTITYAPPEQLDSKARPYSCESDMYSLGVILLELMCPLYTLMERSKKISQLKKGELPDSVLKKYPKEAALILWMTAPNPAHRPSARELLDLDIFLYRHVRPAQSSSNAMHALEIKLELFCAENQTLRKQNADMSVEIQVLKDRLREFENVN